MSTILGSLCFTFCVSRRSLQLTLAWFVFVGWVGLLFSVGELNFDLFLTSSNKLTATVESNAATEKKKCSSCLPALSYDSPVCLLLNQTSPWPLPLKPSPTFHVMLLLRPSDKTFPNSLPSMFSPLTAPNSFNPTLLFFVS